MSEFAAGPAGRIERVRALMVERGYDAIVVRDEANLRWLTGVKGVFDYTFEFPHAAFITADQCLFHTDSRYLNSFEENTPAGSPWVYDMDEGTIPGWVAGKIAANKCRVCAVEDDMQINFYQGIQRGLEDRSVACMLPLMHDDIRKMRAIKDAEEIELMRHAQSITDAAFQHMLGFIKPGMTEKQVRNELENFMFANGADSLAFGSIVASGPNTANPHAVPSDRVIEKGDFVLMDYGAGYCDYRSDMTRTVVMGEPTQEQLNVEEKSAIAKYAATMINDEDFIFIDAGTSTALMIDYIGETNATFVTNGIAHAKRLLKKNLRTYMIGGLVKPITEAIIGAEAVNSMKKFNFTKCFLGTNGIHMDYGFTTVDVEEAMVKMEAVNRSYASIVLADSSKFDKVTAVTFAAIEKACIITDRLVNDKYIDATVVKEVLR